MMVHIGNIPPIYQLWGKVFAARTRRSEDVKVKLLSDEFITPGQAQGLSFRYPTGQKRNQACETS